VLAAPGSARSAPTDLAARRQVAFDRIQELIAQSELLAKRAWRNYYWLQGLTIGLAAITPCLIVLAKENPRNELFNWLQLFVPAIAALCAGLGHIFRWREDAVRLTALAEGIRSQLWRFQTRAGEFKPTLTEDDALDRLVVRVDELNQQSLSKWSAAQLAEAAGPGSGQKPATATSDH
jgi:uncharacterized protein DUF4231